tara:strand:+ start:31 stop:555 length:525 start_codon:yes stop_codon:yes gene_type:complete
MSNGLVDINGNNKENQKRLRELAKESLKVTNTVTGVGGEEIVTDREGTFEIKGSKEGGTGLGYEEKWNNMSNEEKAKYGSLEEFTKQGEEYWRDQNKKTYKATEKRNVKLYDYPGGKGTPTEVRNWFRENSDPESYDQWLRDTTGKSLSYYNKRKGSARNRIGPARLKIEEINN